MTKQPRDQRSPDVFDEFTDGLAQGDYSQFGQWLDAELEKLVARWIHLAAPSASRVGALSNRRADLSNSAEAE
jgi:hypothetical protein